MTWKFVKMAFASNVRNPFVRAFDYLRRIIDVSRISTYWRALTIIFIFPSPGPLKLIYVYNGIREK